MLKRLSYYHKVSFFQKNSKMAHNFQILRFQAAIAPQWLQIVGNSLPNWPFTGCLVSDFTVSINSVFLLECTSVQEKYLSKFLATSDIRYYAVLPDESADIWKKNILNWKLKISNAVVNADITQSQARHIRRLRTQKVNGLCTDSWLLRGEYCIVFIQHNTTI